MKRIFTFSVLLIVAAVLLSSCRKGDPLLIDESYWLKQERGIVVFSDSFCEYYVVETFNGYTVIRSYGLKPFEGAVLYGNFSSWGYRTFYNRTEGRLINGDVRDYWLGYFEAQNRVSFYCY